MHGHQLEGKVQSVPAFSVCERIPGLVEGNFFVSGETFRVLSNALYLKINNKLITVTTRKQGNFSYCILLENHFFAEFKQIGEQDRVVLDKKGIWFPDRRLAIDFFSSLIWSPEPHLNKRFCHQRVKNNLGKFKEYLTDRTPGEGLGGLVCFVDISKGVLGVSESVPVCNLYCQAAIPILFSVLIKIQNGCLAEAMLKASEMIGLGPGLTPSGDDFLMGMMAAFFVCSAEVPSLDLFLRQTIKEVCRSGKLSSTEVSLHFLAEAWDGRFSEKLCKTANSLFFAENTDSIIAHAEELVVIGGTSGLDMAAGILFGGSLILMKQ